MGVKVEIAMFKVEASTTRRYELGDRFERIFHLQWKTKNIRVYLRNDCTDIEIDNFNSSDVGVEMVITGVGREE